MNFSFFSTALVLSSLLLVVVLCSSSSALASNINNNKFLPQHISNKLPSLTEVVDFDSIDPSQIPASVPSDSIIRDRANRYIFVLTAVWQKLPQVVDCYRIIAFDTDTNEYSTTLQSEEIGKTTPDTTIASTPPAAESDAPSESGIPSSQEPGPATQLATEIFSISVAVVNGTFVVRLFGQAIVSTTPGSGEGVHTMFTFDADLKQIGEMESTPGAGYFIFAYSNKVQFPSSSPSPNNNDNRTKNKQYLFTTAQSTSFGVAQLTVYELPWKGLTSGESVDLPGLIISSQMGSPDAFSLTTNAHSGLVFDTERSMFGDENGKELLVCYTPMMNMQCQVGVARINISRTNEAASRTASLQLLDLSKYLNTNTSQCPPPFYPYPWASDLQMIVPSIAIDSVNSVLLVNFGNQNLFKLTLRDDGIVDPTQLFSQGSVGAGIFSPTSLFSLSAMILFPESQTMLVMVQLTTPVRLFQLDYSGQDSTIKQVNVTVVVHSPSIAASRGVSAGALLHRGSVSIVFGVCSQGEMIQFSQNVSTAITTTTTTALSPSSSSSSSSSSSTPSPTSTVASSTATSLPVSSSTTTTAAPTHPTAIPSTTKTSTTTTAAVPPPTQKSTTTLPSFTNTASSLTTSATPTTPITTGTESTSGAPPSTGSTPSSAVSSVTTTQSNVSTPTTSSSDRHNNNNGAALSSNNNNSSPNGSGSKAKTAEIAGGVVAGVVLFALVAFFIYRMNRNKQNKSVDDAFNDNELQVGERYESHQSV